MMNNIDQYSCYYDYIEINKINDFGFEYKILNDKLVVTNIHNDTINLEKDDQIIAVNRVQIAKIKNLSKLLKKNKKIVLTVQRANKLLYIILNQILPVPNVQSQLFDDVLHIKVQNFQFNTAKNIKKHYLKHKHCIKYIILDLRGNGGGLLEEAVKTSELFLQQNLKIVSIKTYTIDHTIIARSFDITKNTPIIILIDEKSASASEIVAAALKENNRALIIGNSSHGKNSIQEIYYLPDTIVKLTTGYYYTPNNTNIHNIGYHPDVKMTNYNIYNVINIIKYQLQYNQNFTRSPV